jgi:hypothetical protein
MYTTGIDVSPADFRRILTVLVDRRLLGSQCCLSKLDLVTIPGNLTADQYIRDVMQPVVVPHFDNHPLATSVVIAAAIPDAMLLPTDECFAQEVPEYAYDGLTCPKYALWDSNVGSWLTVPYGNGNGLGVYLS